MRKLAAVLLFAILIATSLQMPGPPGPPHPCSIGFKGIPAFAGINTPGLLNRTTVALTSGNILALNGTPIAVIAAQGAGTQVLVFRSAFTMTRTATAYVNGSTIDLSYTGQTTGLMGVAVATAVLTTAGAATTKTASGNVAFSSLATTVTDNLGVTIRATGAEYITGTGTAVIDVWWVLLN